MNIELTPISGSSAVAASGYDEATGTLRVQYKSGKFYDRQVPPDVAQAFDDADSKGKFLNSIATDYPAVLADMSEPESGE